jgi:hypothetical protein
MRGRCSCSGMLWAASPPHGEQQLADEGLLPAERLEPGPRPHFQRSPISSTMLRMQVRRDGYICGNCSCMRMGDEQGAFSRGLSVAQPIAAAEFTPLQSDWEAHNCRMLVRDGPLKSPVIGVRFVRRFRFLSPPKGLQVRLENITSPRCAGPKCFLSYILCLHCGE